MVRQHPWVNRREFGESLGDSEGQGRLEGCSPWGCRVRHDLMTARQQHQSKDTTTQMYKVEGMNFPLMDYTFFSSTRSCDCQKPLFLLKKTSYSLLLSSLLQIITQKVAHFAKYLLCPSSLPGHSQGAGESTNPRNRDEWLCIWSSHCPLVETLFLLDSSQWLWSSLNPFL